MKVDKNALKEMIADIVCCDVEELQDGVEFKDGLDVNSVQMLEIIAGIEDEYDIEIASTKMDHFNSINKIVAELEMIEQ